MTAFIFSVIVFNIHLSKSEKLVLLDIILADDSIRGPNVNQNIPKLRVVSNEQCSGSAFLKSVIMYTNIYGEKSDHGMCESQETMKL